MKSVLKEFNIPFTGLAVGKHHYEFEGNKLFFEEFAYHEAEAAQISAKLQLNKTSTFLEFEFSVDGKLLLPCDVCTANVWQHIKGEKKVVVKFGDEFNDEDDELIIIPRSETSFNVAQLIYELAILSIPSKVVHPEGECDEEMIAQLNKYRISENDKEDNDPRWDKLKNFYN